MPQRVVRENIRKKKKSLTYVLIYTRAPYRLIDENIQRNINEIEVSSACVHLLSGAVISPHIVPIYRTE